MFAAALAILIVLILQKFAYSSTSKVVHITNGSNGPVTVEIHENEDRIQLTEATLEPGKFTKHTSRGWTNDANISINVKVKFNQEKQVSKTITNNRSVIFTAKNELEWAKYETWYGAAVYLRRADSSIWRDELNICHNPSCGRGYCEC